MLAAASFGCAGFDQLPPAESPESGLEEAVESVRRAFEREDRLGLMAAVDSAFTPSPSRFEQELIDGFLKYRDIRLDFQAGERSHGPAQQGLTVRWSRSWVVEAGNTVDTKSGTAVLVFSESGNGWRLSRIDGASPFSP